MGKIHAIKPTYKEIKLCKRRRKTEQEYESSATVLNRQYYVCLPP